MLVNGVVLDTIGDKVLVLTMPSKLFIKVEVPDAFLETLGTNNQTTSTIWVDKKDIQTEIDYEIQSSIIGVI